MGYADGYYYGQGRIICDTSTFSVGDTIRVRSMTDSSKVWNQQVATVGTPLVFTVPCYDYYKICTVQTINDTPTEIGGVYKTVDYGQTLFINVLDKTTLGGIQGILNAHQESSLLAIGDEVTIKVGGNDWIMQLGDINSTNHILTFVSKYLYQKSTATTGSYTINNLRTIVNETFYSSIANEDKQYIKALNRYCRYADGVPVNYEDKIWIPTAREAAGTQSSTISTYSLLPIFTTQASRIKTFEGAVLAWWTSDAYNTSQIMRVSESGDGAFSTAIGTPSGVLPCFYLQADS